ncbi:hypothetical protein BW716_05990 [[Flexibacter] sp. ATCC 35208]|nr:hypothetical protein BW716_05990 [[Flexibacter] sp. ATCC 35208]
MQYYDGNGYDRGTKAFEITDQVRNVLATVSDRKNPVMSTENQNVVDHFDPIILTATNYYAFGMPSREALPNNGLITTFFLWSIWASF